jgi:hypothetical protein
LGELQILIGVANPDHSVRTSGQKVTKKRQQVMRKLKMAGFRSFLEQLDFQQNRSAASQSVIGSGDGMPISASTVSTVSRLWRYRVDTNNQYDTDYPPF